MARTKTDAAIDLDCISIKVNGLTNSASNVRCSTNNGAGDGFVYTSSTYTDDDGKTYKYNYEINAQLPESAASLIADDRDRNSNYIRARSDSESLINFTKAVANKPQFDGKATAEADFAYNEGASTTLGNGKADTTGTGTGGDYSVTNTYDQAQSVYSSQLTAVREL